MLMNKKGAAAAQSRRLGISLVANREAPGLVPGFDSWLGPFCCWQETLPPLPQPHPAVKCIVWIRAQLNNSLLLMLSSLKYHDMTQKNF